MSLLRRRIARSFWDEVAFRDLLALLLASNGYWLLTSCRLIMDFSARFKGYFTACKDARSWLRRMRT
jgi:hypothetical protein